MFENFRVFETELAGKKISFETGKMACLANGSVLVRYGAVRDALPEEARAVLEAAFAGQAPEGPALGLRYLVCGTIAGRTLLPALPGAALTRRAGRRCWRETGLLAAFCPGGAEEVWTILLCSELAGRMGL